MGVGVKKEEMDDESINIPVKKKDSLNRRNSSDVFVEVGAANTLSLTCANKMKLYIENLVSFMDVDRSVAYFHLEDDRYHRYVARSIADHLVAKHGLLRRRTMRIAIEISCPAYEVARKKAAKIKKALDSCSVAIQLISVDIRRSAPLHWMIVREEDGEVFVNIWDPLEHCSVLDKVKVKPLVARIVRAANE